MTDLATQFHDTFQGSSTHYAEAMGSGFRPVEGKLTPQLIRDKHLAGKLCLGIYLMRKDNHVRVSCADFDNHDNDPKSTVEAEANAIYAHLVSKNIPAVLERSQSGVGFHVWIVLDDWVPAATVRRFWEAVSHTTMLQLGEVYPRQDELSGKGHGNLIRLPLWNKSEFLRCDLSEKVGEATLLAYIDQHPLPLTKGAGGFQSLPDKVKQAWAFEPKLSDRWDAGTKGFGGADDSKSGLCMSFLALCANKAKCSQAELEKACIAWCQHNAYRKPDRWVRMTCSKVASDAQAQQEAQGARGRGLVGQLKKLGSIEARPSRWLWEDMIPTEALTIFGGPPESYKTWYSLQLAAHVTGGHGFPGDKPCKMGHAILCTQEDHPNVIAERATFLGVDPDFFSVLDTSEGGLTLDDVPGFIAEYQEQNDGLLRLLIIDPLQGHLGNGKSANSEADVRPCLANIRSAAQEHSVAVVGIMHHRKNTEEIDAGSIKRVAGSIAWTAVPRCVFNFGATRLQKNDGTQEARVKVEPAKNSLSRKREGFKFLIDNTGFHYLK